MKKIPDNVNKIINEFIVKPEETEEQIKTVEELLKLVEEYINKN